MDSPSAPASIASREQGFHALLELVLGRLSVGVSERRRAEVPVSAVRREVQRGPRLLQCLKISAEALPGLRNSQFCELALTGLRGFSNQRRGGQAAVPGYLGRHALHYLRRRGRLGQKRVFRVRVYVDKARRGGKARAVYDFRIRDR